MLNNHRWRKKNLENSTTPSTPPKNGVATLNCKEDKTEKSKIFPSKWLCLLGEILTEARSNFYFNELLRLYTYSSSWLRVKLWGRVTDDKREEDDDDAAGWCDKIASLVAGELTSLHGLVMMTGWRGNIQHFFLLSTLKSSRFGKVWTIYLRLDFFYLGNLNKFISTLDQISQTNFKHKV